MDEQNNIGPSPPLLPVGNFPERGGWKAQPEMQHSTEELMVALPGFSWACNVEFFLPPFYSTKEATKSSKPESWQGKIFDLKHEVFYCQSTLCFRIASYESISYLLSNHEPLSQQK